MISVNIGILVGNGRILLGHLLPFPWGEERVTSLTYSDLKVYRFYFVFSVVVLVAVEMIFFFNPELLRVFFLIIFAEYD